jgi:hypothetical protein
MRKPPPFYIANFDSMAAMVRGTANYLKQKGVPVLGTMPAWSGPAVRTAGNLIQQLPWQVKDQLYALGGAGEALSPRKLHKAKIERIEEWVIGLYPRRKYPAIALGSSNGAAVHLYAALGIPWLPQTFMIPVARSGVHPDEPLQDIDWAQEPARRFLRANPDVQLHHMHDPNQDRLMIQHMTYFRVKRLRLSKVYENFIMECLEPGGTLFIMECNLKWPTTKLDERYIFQFGALGGADAQEFMQGGERVKNYLQRYESHRTQWNPPAADGARPEAEWGFEPAINGDIERLAQWQRYKLRRVQFENPESLSPLVADLYRWWNKKRGIIGNRMLVESFIVMEPFLTVRTGSIPFWMVFNKETSKEDIIAYLDSADPVDEIYMMLFSHGVESIGLVSIGEWRKVLDRARKKAAFIAVDQNAYPRHFAVLTDYYFQIQDKIKARYPMPPPLRLNQLDEFLNFSTDRYQVQWN